MEDVWNVTCIIDQKTFLQSPWHSVTKSRKYFFSYCSVFGKSLLLQHVELRLRLWSMLIYCSFSTSIAVFYLPRGSDLLFRGCNNLFLWGCNFGYRWYVDGLWKYKDIIYTVLNILIEVLYIYTKSLRTSTKSSIIVKNSWLEQKTPISVKNIALFYTYRIPLKVETIISWGRIYNEMYYNI